MPFFQTASATGGGGMLSNEDRMTAEWRLFAVIFRFGRRQSLSNKIIRMFSNFNQAFFINIFQIFRLQFKAAPEFRLS